MDLAAPIWIFELCVVAHYHDNELIFIYLYFHMVFNNSSLFMSSLTMLLRTTNNDQLFIYFMFSYGFQYFITWPSHCYTHYQRRLTLFFSLCFHIVVNNSSLIKSMTNLIRFNINSMDMKRHMLMCFFIFMLISREKEWGSDKDGVVIMKKGK
jgi:hypothetical protein